MAQLQSDTLTPRQKAVLHGEAQGPTVVRQDAIGDVTMQGGVVYGGLVLLLFLFFSLNGSGETVNCV